MLSRRAGYRINRPVASGAVPLSLSEAQIAQQIPDGLKPYVRGTLFFTINRNET